MKIFISLVRSGDKKYYFTLRAGKYGPINKSGDMPGQAINKGIENYKKDALLAGRNKEGLNKKRTSHTKANITNWKL